MEMEDNQNVSVACHKLIRGASDAGGTELDPKQQKCEDKDGEDLYEEEKYNLFPCQAPGCSDHFETIKKYEEHYHAKHWHVCSQCKKTYPTEFLLGLHVQECHDMFFKVKSEKQPMFECYLQACVLKFMTPEERFKHCVDDHKFPQNYLHSTSKRDFYPKPKQPKKKGTKNKSGKIPTEQNETSSAAQTDITPEAAMDTSMPSTSGKQKKSQPKLKMETEQEQQNKSKKPSNAKKPGMHIQFGHSTATRFVPRYNFAMSKENTGNSKHDGKEETKMDLSVVKDALDNVGHWSENEGMKKAEEEMAEDG
jgi:hypothetical protein